MCYQGVQCSVMCVSAYECCGTVTYHPSCAIMCYDILSCYGVLSCVMVCYHVLWHDMVVITCVIMLSGWMAMLLLAISCLLLSFVSYLVLLHLMCYLSSFVITSYYVLPCVIMGYM